MRVALYLRCSTDRLARIRATGRTLGRPKATVSHSDVLSLRSAGMSNRAIARKLAVSEGTIRGLLRASA